MLESGAEAYRVEDSLQRLCRAYGVETSEIFAIPSLLIVSLCDPEGHSHTRVRRLYHRGTDLWRVDRLNSLCRWVCAGRPPFPEVDQQLLLLCRAQGCPPALQAGSENGPRGIRPPSRRRALPLQRPSLPCCLGERPGTPSAPWWPGSPSSW